MSTPPPYRPSVVIVGGGMGGIQAAKTLATAPVDITLVNPRNYYLFQPLIYEVANALLQAEDVAHSIRGMLRYLPNLRFRVAAASSVDWERSELRLDDGDRIGFDYLILATGLQADFRGIPGAAEHALPLKSLDDAVKIRTQMLRRLETVAAHPALVPAGALDVVVVGGGTTGVETAGAFAEIYHHALPEEFADLDFSHAGITLLEAGDTILPAFHPRMQRAAQRMLMRRGVRVRLRSQVAQVGPASVTLTDGLEIPAGMIVWATGVRATRLADSLALPQAPDGRILVQPNLSLPGHPEAFAIGDMAALPLPAGGLHPALAQFAIQGGRHAAREIMRHIGGAPFRPFRYWDKGMTASVGRDGGIVQTGHIRFSGRLAFFAWGVLHSLYVPGWRNRLSIDLNWLWSYVTHRRAALMLIGETPAAQEQLGSWQPPPAVEPRPELDNAHHRDIPGDERRTPPSGQALGTPRLRAAAQVPARAGVSASRPVSRSRDEPGPAAWKRPQDKGFTGDEVPIRLMHERVCACVAWHQVAALEVLQLRMDMCRGVLPFDVLGVEYQALDPVVGVETDAPDANLHDPRSHLLGLRGDGDGPGGFALGGVAPIRRRAAVRWTLWFRCPLQNRRTPREVGADLGGGAEPVLKRPRPSARMPTR